jgi:hypothetical protein
VVLYKDDERCGLKAMDYKKRCLRNENVNESLLMVFPAKRRERGRDNELKKVGDVC